MKKIVKTAVAMAVLATPAIAAGNLENPLYLPSAGEVYSKLGAGLMYKKADDSEAMRNKDHAFAEEFPIGRFYGDLGFGITDRVAIRGSFAWTQDNDIDRKGMNAGRIGLVGRVFDGKSTDGIVWDVYADAHLGGVSKMTGSYTPEGFKYDNYSNGRWGAFVGTSVGKTWDKLTVAAFAEILPTIGNSNNDIDVTPIKAEAAAGLAGVPGGATTISACMANPTVSPACPAVLKAYGITQLTDSLSVNLKSTFEYNLGLKAQYQVDKTWAVGGAVTYKHHADNGIKSVATPQNAAGQKIADGLAADQANMKDGFDEYIFGVSVANQLSDSVQVAVYGEYTYDTAHPMSQNGTDTKAELGARVNVRF